VKRTEIAGRKSEMKRGTPLQGKKALKASKGLEVKKGLTAKKGLETRKRPLVAKKGLETRVPLVAATKPNRASLERTEKRPRTRKSEAPFRHEVMAAYGKVCKACGSTTWVQAAHLWAKSQGGPTIVDNGVPMCRTHHEDYDQYRLQMRYEWLAPNQLAWLAGSGYATWDEFGQPVGRGARRFAPMTSGQVARRRERRSA
jgi:hypothetical protein